MHRGFTIIEIMIAIAIIALLSAIVIPNVLAYRMMGQRNACIANMRMILNAEEAYCFKYGQYASDIADLCGESGKTAFLKNMPQCPSSGVYSFIMPDGSNAPMVTCTGGKYHEGYEHRLESNGTAVEGD